MRPLKGATTNIQGMESYRKRNLQAYMKKIGKRLQKRRISLKREIKDVASAVHITPARLEKIEAGNAPHLQIGLFRSLCIELELDPYETIRSKE